MPTVNKLFQRTDKEETLSSSFYEDRIIALIPKFDKNIKKREITKQSDS